MAQNLTRYELAETIHTILDIPHDKEGDPAFGYLIVNAILTAMRDALLRGETIKVRGFGTFKVVNGLPRRTGANFIARGRQRSPVPLECPAKKRIIFQPSEQVRAMLNAGTTWDEKRAMEIWNK